MKKVSFIALAVFLLPVAAQAGYSYSWFEVGYIGDVSQETPGGNSESGDGLDLRVNFLAGDHVYITGHLDEIEADDSEVDVDRFGLGFGIHNDFDANIGLFATVTYEDFESEIPGFESESGFGGSVGIRYNVQEDFEAYGGASYADYQDVEGVFLNIGGVWAFSNSYAVVAEYSKGEFTLNDINDTDLEREDVRLALRVQF